MKIQNVAAEELKDIRRKVMNAFTEKGAEARDAILALIDRLETSEVEFDVTDLKDEIESIVKDIIGTENQAVTDKLTNAMNEKFKLVQNSIKPNERFTPAIKNQIAAAILRTPSVVGENKAVSDAVQEVMVKNGISGLAFQEIVDFTISNKWEDLNPLYAMLHQTFYTKFHYTTQDMLDVEIFAKGWKKTNNGEKIIQQINAITKQILTQYVYKRQQIAFEDIDEIEQAGEWTRFLTWLNQELDKMIINSIITAILVGDAINTTNNRITTFETIGTKTVADAFTSIKTVTTSESTVQDIRIMCDMVRNPDNKKKVLILTQQELTRLSGFRYAAGGDSFYRMIEEMRGQFGVDEIYITDVILKIPNLAAICFIPDGYWVKEKNYISVAYPFWENNVQNFQKERNIGGQIHDLLSSAILKVTPTP